MHSTSSFAPLHVKSDYSLGYGTASIEELVERAAALGYRFLALTDLENLYGQLRFHHQCRLHGIQSITGIELRPGFDGRGRPGSRSGRIVLLARDRDGYRSLCRIVGIELTAKPRTATRIPDDLAGEDVDFLGLASRSEEAAIPDLSVQHP